MLAGNARTAHGELEQLCDRPSLLLLRLVYLWFTCREHAGVVEAFLSARQQHYTNFIAQPPLAFWSDKGHVLLLCVPAQIARPIRRDHKVEG